MNRPVEQTLLSIIPTLNSATLPPSLLDLASSLLAQSRHRVSTLKAEEEIARLYACAHLACDRLKTSLNLPPIDPRPPIPPRIYKKLYAHLDSSLPHTSTGTPRSVARARGPTTPGTVRFRDALIESSPLSGRRARGDRPTPSKEQSLAQFRSLVKANGVGTNASTSNTSITRAVGGYPSWVRPTIRFVGAVLDASRLVPFVIAGIDAIAAPQGKPTDDEWVGTNMTALVAALVFYSIRAAAGAGGEKTGGNNVEGLDDEQYKALEWRMLKAMAKAREEVKVPAPGRPRSETADDASSWEGWQDLRAKTLKKALGLVVDRKWLESDWFQGIQDLPVDSLVDERTEERSPSGDDSHRQRADTMLQEKYDYLSERRRRDYRVWKAKILQRIEKLERQAPEAMEIDS